MQAKFYSVYFSIGFEDRPVKSFYSFRPRLLVLQGYFGLERIILFFLQAPFFVFFSFFFSFLFFFFFFFFSLHAHNVIHFGLL